MFGGEFSMYSNSNHPFFLSFFCPQVNPTFSFTFQGTFKIIRVMNDIPDY